MFEGIKLRTFLSTPQEWHALVIGFCVGFCPWLYKLLSLSIRKPPIKGEEHYFVTGIVPGFIALLYLLIGLAKLTKEVIL